MAACWVWVAWAFHAQRYATINWAATGFAVAFVGQALLLLAAAGALMVRSARSGRPSAQRAVVRAPSVDPAGPMRQRDMAGSQSSPDVRRRVGLALLGFGLLVQPWVGTVFGRSWREAEWFAIAPDPTVVATLGLLLCLRQFAGSAGAGRGRRRMRWLWPIPLVWCAASGATLWTLQAPDALLLPALAAVAVLATGTAWKPRSGTATPA
jgi:hypothetical protein